MKLKYYIILLFVITAHGVVLWLLSDTQPLSATTPRVPMSVSVRLLTPLPISTPVPASPSLPQKASVEKSPITAIPAPQVKPTTRVLSSAATASSVKQATPVAVKSKPSLITAAQAPSVKPPIRTVKTNPLSSAVQEKPLPAILRPKTKSEMAQKSPLQAIQMPSPPVKKSTPQEKKLPSSTVIPKQGRPKLVKPTVGRKTPQVPLANTSESQKKPPLVSQVTPRKSTEAPAMRLTVRGTHSTETSQTTTTLSPSGRQVPAQTSTKVPLSQNVQPTNSIKTPRTAAVSAPVERQMPTHTSTKNLPVRETQVTSPMKTLQTAAAPVGRQPLTQTSTTPLPTSQPIVPPSANAGYLHNPAPAYPPLSRQLGEEGTVLLRVKVNVTGSADSVQVSRSSGSSRLDNAAINTVSRWRFVPARQGNSPVSAWVTVPVTFRLE